MYLSDETWEKIKPALKQGFGIAIACILLKWWKCPLLRSVCMREDFGQILVKRFKRRMEYEHEIYLKWLHYPSRSYKK